MSDPVDTKLTENVDLANGHDMRLARSIAKRYGMDNEQRQRMVKIGFELAEGSSDQRTRASALDSLVAMDRLQQSDEHLERKEARADDGKPSEVIVYEVNIPGPKKIVGD